MALTQGHAIACCDRNRRGGIKRIWLMETDKLTGVVSYAVLGTPTGAAGGEIESFPTTPGTTPNEIANWFEFEFLQMQQERMVQQW